MNQVLGVLRPRAGHRGPAVHGLPHTPRLGAPGEYSSCCTCRRIHNSRGAYSARWAAAGDAAASLAALLPLVEDRIDPSERGPHRVVEAATERRRAAVERSRRPRSPGTARHRWTRWPLARPSSGDAAGVAGGGRSHLDPVPVRGFHHDPVPGRYFFWASAGPGWGMPAAVGVSLARGGARLVRRRRRLGWRTGCRRCGPRPRGPPVVFAVVNNRHHIPKDNLRGRRRQRA